MKRIVLSLIMITLPFTMLDLRARTSRSANYDKRYKCEEHCKTKWWQCRQRAFRKKDRTREKSIKICQTFLASCMNRCQRYQ